MSFLGKSPGRRIRILPVMVLALVVGAALVSATARSAVAAEPVATAFPRLSMWWPNNDTQSAADRARYDFIGLQNHDANHIAELRALNSGMIVLGSTNARELNYRLTGYNDSLNVELRSASTDWMLTQVGSRLPAGITNSTTTIPVGDATKFGAGEMVLCDRELMYVNSVGASSLTVTRGQVTPTASHAAGARIAAVVSVWSGAVEYDLTASCPKVDVGYGPETWSDWNVRRGRTVVNSADWDGLIIDCYDPNPSWWVTNGYNRSIDANRDNVADNLDAFTTAWNTGMNAYGNALRAAVGPSTVILTNGKGRNYSLNGSNFETFPQATTSLWAWNTVVIGPYAAPHASYLDFCANAAAPNLTFIETFGTQTNYQFMRYGLCTTLLGDGFFSYVSSVGNHGVGGLWWYDEYDNAGKGRGYLGQPTGAAYSPGSNVWRRDYEGGIALVNPDTVAHTVSLGGTFRKIKGTQAPSVNDGSLVTAVTLQPRDGIVLLREGGALDMTPPTSSLLAGPAAPQRWYTAPVTLKLQASDTGSGVKSVYLDRGAGTEAVQSGFQFSLSGEGDRSLTYWATDEAGNVEAKRTAKVGIDATPPKVSSNATTTPYPGTATIEITAVDGLSGPGQYQYQVDGGAIQTGNKVTLSSKSYPKTYQVKYRASDAAGNWSTWSDSKTITITQPNHVKLYRFYNKKTGTHFYTASVDERDSTIASLSYQYAYEGVSYRVSQDPREGTPVYRFYNHRTGVHFYSASVAERDDIIARLGYAFAFEGVAFYASAVPTADAPVYRFYNKATSTHFYTASANERDTVAGTLGMLFNYEGPAYSAWLD